MSLQLYCINYGNFEDALKATVHCLNIIGQKATIIHPDPKPELVKIQMMGLSPMQSIHIVKAKSKSQNECFSFELPQYITCDYAIGIQWDGFIVNPFAWTNDFFKYDWIAPPWPLQNIPNPEWRVGSGGFCMFSKRMSQLWPKLLDLDSNNDWQIGATKRDLFEAQGMKYAPIELAAKFGKEHNLEDMDIKEGESFGFHDFRINVEYRKRYKELVYGRSN